MMGEAIAGEKMWLVEGRMRTLACIDVDLGKVKRFLWIRLASVETIHVRPRAGLTVWFLFFLLRMDHGTL